MQSRKEKPAAQSEKDSSSHQGFIERENTQRLKASKIGKSAGYTQNVLASSANIAISPDATALGEDSAPEEDLEGDVSRSISEKKREARKNVDPNEEEPLKELYSTGSDELEMGTAVLEEATQAPVGNEDPSSARILIEDEPDDDSEF